MEKGLKNLTQAYRSAQKKLENGTYHDHEDSGVGVSDLEEEQEDHVVDLQQHMSTIPETHYTGYPPYPMHQQRVPSIQSMLQPMQQHQHQQLPMQQSMQQPMQQSMQQPMQQTMPQTMPQQMQYSSHSHHLSHQQ
jgi:hypothetical protein